MSTYTERRSGVLHGTCLDCGATTHQPDKGLGRANLAAWKTRHQHTAALADPETETDRSEDRGA